MYKRLDYNRFYEITERVAKLEQLNRTLDIDKLESISSIKNELVEEFIATNNIEDDIVSLSTAKQFLRKGEELSDNKLLKRWIGIKYAHDVIWDDKYSFQNEYIHQAHRALMSKTDIAGGVYKTKLNQVSSLVTAHPDDVPKMMFELFTTYISSKMSDGSSVYNIIPMISEFLAIHPYEDGNGRMSRLIMNRELYDAGFKFVKYISISKFIWEQKDKYIAALEKRNNGWASKTLIPNDLVDLFIVILDALISACEKAHEYMHLIKYNYSTFSDNVLKVSSRAISFKEITALLKPSNSNSSLKSWLKVMVQENKLKLIGEGKASKYIAI